MTLKKFTNIAFAAALGLGVFAFGSVDADAQGNSRWAHEKNRIKKQQKAYEKRQKAIRKAEEARYRAYRDGRYYDYDQRQADMLRRAIEDGYRQGYNEGVNDRRYGRRGSYGGSPIYRSGSYGYDPYVDRDQYQHYFREGFERGYYDGYNADSRYGYRRNNTMNILGSILSGILNLQRY